MEMAAREQNISITPIHTLTNVTKIKGFDVKNWCNENCTNKKSIITQANENLSSAHCGQLKIHMTMFYLGKKRNEN